MRTQGRHGGWLFSGLLSAGLGGTVLLAAACGGAGRSAQPAPPGAAEPLARPAIPWEPEVYIAHRVSPAPVVDGRLEEEGWKDAPWTRDFTDIEGPSRTVPRFRTRGKILWDDDYFYVGAELEEPDLWATLTARDSVIYQDHDFEIFIDPDGDTHEYYELEINALGTVWDLFLVRPYRDGGPALHAWDIAGLKTAVSIDGTLNRPGDLDRGWSVEIALPWAVLKEAARRTVPPGDGDRWRVNFSRVEWRTDVREGRYEKRLDDKTGKPLPEDNWVWSPQGLIAMHYPEMWGIVVFSSREAGDENGRVNAGARKDERNAAVGGREDRGESEESRGSAAAGEERPRTRGAGPYTPEERAGWALRLVYYAERDRRAAYGAYSTDLAELGLARAPAGSPAWPPRIAATPNRFEASLAFASEDGSPRTLTIAEDGAVR